MLFGQGGNDEAFSQAAKKLLDDRSRSQTMGRVGRERMIKHFSQLRMCRGYEKIYSDISQKGGHRRVLN